MLDKILSLEEVEYYDNLKFNIYRVVFDTNKKILSIFSTSLDSIDDKDIDFLKSKLHTEFKDVKVNIDNIKKKEEKTKEIPEEVLMMDSEVDKEVIEEFQNSLEYEDRDFLKNFKENIKTSKEKEKKSETKRTYYRPKTNKFGEVRKIKYLKEEDTFPTLEGEVFSISKQDTRTEDLKIAKFFLYDGTESLCIKAFLRNEQNEEFDNSIKNGTLLRVNGEYKYDMFDKQMTLIMKNYELLPPKKWEDNAKEKRVEIHAHTQMSLLEGSIAPEELVQIYKEMGAPGIFVTDVACVQSYPNIMDLGDENFKIGYGLEANLYDDDEKYVQDNKPGYKDYVVFDIETTGLNPYECEIIEIGAVKVRDGEIIDRYNQLIRPSKPVPLEIQKLTNITDDMLDDKPSFDEIKDNFLNFIDGKILVAHNANFDVGFIRYHFGKLGINVTNPFVDTMKMAQDIVEGVRNYKLDTLTDKLGIKLVSHHRAVDDAEATAYLFINMVNILINQGKIKKYSELDKIVHNDLKNNFRTLIYVQNYTGLKNLYHIITKSCTEYFHKKPRVPLSVLYEYKEGLIVGAEAIKGEIFSYFESGFTDEYIKKKLELYDFCEIQPTDNYLGLLGNKYPDRTSIYNMAKRYLTFLEANGKKIIAGGNVFEKTSDDAILRKILGKSRGEFRADKNPPLPIRTTDEIKNGLDYVSEVKLNEYVIKNSKELLEAVDTMRAIPREKYPPIIEGSEDELRNTCYENAKRIYGENLPKEVKDRLEKELHSIIGNGYSVMYIIAKKLVQKSNSDGYLVGSRGSVGSSFVATMSDITEVNPLPAHYLCPHCKHTEFYNEYYIGIDLPDKNCPQCGTAMNKMGYNIPFETFLGFKGDKEPDIDLNFAGEYQPVAHKFVEELFGEGYVFRAGTLATIQDKVGYGYVKNYFEEHDIKISDAETNRLVSKLIGIKRTTGQHPGGIMIVPKTNDIHDFSPIQYPADDPNNGAFTTHFAYKALHSNILKLDILGHDGPTMIRMIEDLTGVKSSTIKFDDKEVLKMFSSAEPIGLTGEELGDDVATIGIPEFGTDFVRNMLLETKPQSFADLIRISGLSHGTNVWATNAQDLVDNGVCKISDVIATREDIMTYLLKAGLPNDFSFFTMEKVRKGKGLTDEDVKKMSEYDLPSWYVDSCKKIKYMFPKAHAVAYVMLSFRLAWYKLNYPKEFYATILSTKKDNFEYETVSGGLELIEARMEEIKKEFKPTTKEKEVFKVLEIVREMYLRGFVCEDCDIYKSEVNRFMPSEKGIIPPLSVVPSLGEGVAQSIERERTIKKFISVEDLQNRTKINKNSIAFMIKHNILNDFQQTNQISLF